MSTPNGSGLSFATISISSAGDNVIIPGTRSGLVVRRVVLALAEETTVQFKAGSRELSGPMSIDSLGLGFSDQAYYAVDPDEDFIISLGDAVQAGGTVWYQRGPL